MRVRAIDLLIASLTLAWILLRFKAQRSGVEIRGDIDVFVAGRTSQSSAQAQTASRPLRRLWAAGILWSPLLSVEIWTGALDLLEQEADICPELSSFQLERAGDLNLAVATVLNLHARSPRSP